MIPDERGDDQIDTRCRLAQRGEAASPRERLHEVEAVVPTLAVGSGLRGDRRARPMCITGRGRGRRSGPSAPTHGNQLRRCLDTSYAAHVPLSARSTPLGAASTARAPNRTRPASAHGAASAEYAPANSTQQHRRRRPCSRRSWPARRQQRDVRALARSTSDDLAGSRTQITQHVTERGEHSRPRYRLRENDNRV